MIMMISKSEEEEEGGGGGGGLFQVYDFGVTERGQIRHKASTEPVWLKHERKECRAANTPTHPCYFTTEFVVV